MTAPRLRDPRDLRIAKRAGLDIRVKARTALLMVRNRETSEIFRELAHRVYSQEASYLLRRDLAIPLITRPVAKISFHIRPIESRDMEQILEERPRRLPVLLANIPTCYVAQTSDGSICYMQWLVTADQQNRLIPYFKGELADYGEDTVLLEFAYTFKRFRGAGIMSAAMAEIAEKGLELGARWASTYVKSDNIASLKGCANAGFHPHMVRSESWRAFRLQQAFTPLTQTAPIHLKAGHR
jgi:GNAT superfamily N-acetyltransferase